MITGAPVSRVSRLPAAALAIVAAALVVACAPTPEKPEEVPSPDTFECMLEAERWLVRFTDQEARLLTPQGERINLYQVATGSGVRFTNGLIELRGRGTDAQAHVLQFGNGFQHLEHPLFQPNARLHTFDFNGVGRGGIFVRHWYECTMVHKQNHSRHRKFPHP